MSFLLRTNALRSARISTPTSAARFSTSLRANKSAVDATKDTLKSVDRKVSDAAVSGIEAGENVAQSAKSTLGAKSNEAKGKAQELKGEAKGKASEMEGKAKGAKEEAKSKI